MAVAVGLLVGIVPTIGLNVLLWFHVEAEARQNIRDAAETMLRLVDDNLDTAMTALVGLGLQSHGCTPEGGHAFRQALLRTPEIAEISFTGPGGQPHCTVGGDLPRVVHRLSPDNDTEAPQVKLAIAQIGDSGGPRVVQLVWHGGGGAKLRMLVPGERLIPSVVIGRLQADFMTRLLLVDGTFVAQRQAVADGTPLPAASVSAPAQEMRLLSKRYPIAVATAVRAADMWGSYREIFVYGNLGGLALTVLMVLGALAVTRLLEGPAREIADSLRRGEFVPFYQPVIDLKTGRLLGCEVLVRRLRRDGGVDGPGAFVPMAEATGQIFKITHALMVRARDELAGLYGVRQHLKVSFNLVAGHFDDFAIVDEVRDVFAGSPLRPCQLVFEVTERQPLPNLARARAVIARLQEFGARVSVDDVGTGHGGLTYLMKLGVDQMKVDKMFIDAIGTDRYSAAIVDTLIKLAADLGLELVAEGVETPEQVSYLRSRGVRAAQGFIFAPPLPARAYEELVLAMEPVAPEATPETAPVEAGWTQAAASRAAVPRVA
jgi:sensor c-di-GMP phosphodiesterase-like protein